MNTKNIKNVILYSFLGFSALVAQEQKIKKANKAFENYAYIDAQKTYLSVVEQGYTSADVYEKLGDSYYFNADLESAAIWYGKLFYEYASNVKPEYLFRYSHALKNIGNYELSDKVMEQFGKVTGVKEQRVKFFNKDRNYLALIEKQSGKFKVYNVEGVNTSGSDFGPSYYNDNTIYFASDRSNIAKKNIHTWTNAPFLNLFKADKDSNQLTNLNNSSKVNGNINSKYHESSTVFTKDGKTMYFTRNNYTDKKKKSDTNGTTKLKLYRAVLKDGRWSNELELPFNSDEYSVAHPALSKDEKRLYFASDMKGTKGLSDLFFVEILGVNKYSEPQNLGSNINTEGRETFPFISNNGDLFFASDGHIGLGGLDIFIAKATPSKKNFEEAYNVGKPINSKYDDFSFILNSSKKEGYFTSNREGGLGNDDIYAFEQVEELITTCDQYLKGIITDAETRALLPGSKVTLLTEDLKPITSTVADGNAFYELPIECDNKYVIRAEEPNYKPTEVDFASSSVFEFNHNQPIQLRKGAPIINNVAAKVGDDLAKLLQLNPIYFDFDKDFIRPDAALELQKVIAVMKEYPNLEIDVRSHTDSRAPFAYNIDLSTRRNKNTIKYIVEKGGMSTSRLTGRGYGEIELTNECADGVNCSEEKHQLNRRSEFIIVKQ
ncbi:OmpA family protein [Aquimarina agarilytica]|uniref:OmpA family protein n=1 Tax=Aquimarina agarilytica TaxID=1087449 RepID=UPI0002D4E333|nr:OmpA family protein [Aquimarina agarilytica]